MKIFDIYLFWVHIAPTYYWLMYSISFLIGYLILRSKKILKENELDNLIIYLFIWVILGWRIGYVLFYNFSYFLNNPQEILAFWKWWMSFHWWVIWVIISVLVFSKIYKINFSKLIDEIIITIPIWLWLWRLGNYINKELLWVEYYWPLCIQNWNKCYFPSPLLELIFEWIILFCILQYLSGRIKNYWNLSWAFLFFYWVFRFLIEFIRAPDIQIWYIWNFITMWQLLSLPMIILWIYFWLFYKKYPINKKYE